MIISDDEEDRDEEFYGLNYDSDSALAYFYDEEDPDDTYEFYPWVEDEVYDHLKDIDDYFRDEFYDDYFGEGYIDEID